MSGAFPPMAMMLTPQHLDPKTAPNRPVHEAQIDRLVEMFNRYHTEDEVFLQGQIVTPLADSGIRGVGEPMIVLETNYGCEIYWGNAADHGTRPTIRVAGLGNESIQTFWLETWQLERYDAAVHNKPRESADGPT